ncbi:MAG TPA: hypothetical protein PL193_10015 [Xanthobacteraceae bacterium]|nr:hypothetical protein [Xanthobacteraceae bacterium]
MKPFVPAVFAAVAFAASVSAASAQTFNIATMSPAEARQQMVQALYLSFTSQCKSAPITEDESKKLLDFSDTLARKLNLNADQFEKDAEKQVFDAWEKDEAAFCAKYGPQAKAYAKRIP